MSRLVGALPAAASSLALYGQLAHLVLQSLQVVELADGEGKRRLAFLRPVCPPPAQIPPVSEREDGAATAWWSAC